MNFSEYQKAARRTAVYPRRYKITYPAFALFEEVGEIAGKLAKHMRDGLHWEETKNKLFYELGDALWQIANLAEDLGFSLEEIAAKNLEKLSSRMKRGKLHGEGDER